MAHVGKELALCTIGRFRGVLGSFKLQTRLFAFGDVGVHPNPLADLTLLAEHGNPAHAHGAPGVVHPMHPVLHVEESACAHSVLPCLLHTFPVLGMK